MKITCLCVRGVDHDESLFDVTDEEIIAEIAGLSGCTITASKTSEELQFLLALVDGAFERGYRAAQDGARK